MSAPDQHAATPGFAPYPPFFLPFVTFRLRRFADTPVRLFIVAPDLRSYIGFQAAHRLDGARCVMCRSVAEAEADPRRRVGGSMVVVVPEAEA